MTIQQIFDEAKGLFEKKNTSYNDSYKKMGNMLSAMFPRGFELKSQDDFEFFFLFIMIMAKAMRFSCHLSKKEYELDTVRDMGIYSFMLEEMIQQKGEKK